MHITLRVRRDVPNLRNWKRAQAIRRAFIAGCKKQGFRIVDWSILGNHLHLIVEADTRKLLSKGMQGFGIRVAKAINKAAGRRKGTVFTDRYHLEILKTPRQVRYARRYVIQNYKRHAAEDGQHLSPTYVDVHSSWAWFDGWESLPRHLERMAHNERAGPSPVAPAEGWLLSQGWKMHGKIAVGEVPRGRRRA